MTLEDMAREAGFSFDPTFESCGPNPMWIAEDADLTRFAALVRRQALEDAAWMLQTLDPGRGEWDSAAAVRSLKDKP